MATPPFIRTGLSTMDLLLVLFVGLKFTGHLDWNWFVAIWPAYVILIWWIFENAPRKPAAS